MRIVFWKLRLAMKYVWRCIGRSWRLIEFCKVCGREQPVTWYAPDVLWAEVVEGRCNVLCPECFNRLARRKKIYLWWTCSEERDESPSNPALP
uniref:Uncharacterized protein n=1 Tax=viral metagenome TaxID=1070528 RepID=A0A6H1ZYV5_9ZZZZ